MEPPIRHFRRGGSYDQDNETSHEGQTEHSKTSSNNENHLVSIHDEGQRSAQHAGGESKHGKNGLYRRVSSNFGVTEKSDGDGDSESERRDRLRGKDKVDKDNGDFVRRGGQTVTFAPESRIRHLSAHDSSAAYYQKQQSMVEQSRALLEESKAKHHALIAQAHNMQNHIHVRRDGSNGDTADTPGLITVNYVPKPPLDRPGSEKRSSSRATRHSR